ncbi:MAG: RNA polymerase sigma factor [Verrucomicrobiales bacterium]|nr:RNA polymerase sigma factor [Verrucomicrobiales bacterium]
MENDRELLERYLTHGEEAAFAEVVRRHLPHVFGAALRQTGDRGLAEDVSQEVFRDLARKARGLPEGLILAAWLHRATRYAARDAIRNGQRRLDRERKASTMETLDRNHPETPWEEVQGWLDATLDELPPADRDALCVRYLEQRSLAEVATSLGTTPEAARKRVDRALDRLRELLGRRGVRTTAAALGEALLAHAAPPLPAGLAASVVGAAASVSSAAPAGAVPMLMATTSSKPAALLVAAALLVGIPLVRQERVIAQLQSRIQESADPRGGVPPDAIRADPGEDPAAETLRLEAANASLRQQISRVEAQLKSMREPAATVGTRLLGDRHPIADLVDSGQSTPETAFRSSLAAMRSGDTNRMAQLWTWPPETSPVLLASYLRAADPEHPRGLAADLRSGGIASVVLHRVEPAGDGDCWLVYHLELADGIVGPVYQTRMRPHENQWRIVLQRTGEPDQAPVAP